MKMGRIFIFLSVLFVSFIGRLPTEGSEGGPIAVKGAPDGVVTFYGILCGVAKFSDENLNLAYPDKDARDLQAALLRSYNWKASNIKLLLNSDVSSQTVHEAILEVAQKADADDLVLFFFSGHGSKVLDKVPYDEADGEDESLIDFYGNNILDDTLAGWIKELPTTKYVIFIDTCFSGGMITGKGRWLETAKSFSDATDGFGADLVSSGTKDLADLMHGVVVTASGNDEAAMESESLANGFLTHYLLQSLSKAGDRNGNGWVSAEECFQYASPRVTNENPQQHTQLFDGYSRGELDFYELEITDDQTGGDNAGTLEVVATTPASDGLSVEIEFNQAIQTGTAFNQISIWDSNGLFKSQATTVSGQNILHLALDQPLGSFCTYTVTVPVDGVWDKDGRGLGTEYTFTFTTPAIVTDKASSSGTVGGGCAVIGWPLLAFLFLSSLAVGDLRGLR